MNIWILIILTCSVPSGYGITKNIETTYIEFDSKVNCIEAKKQLPYKNGCPGIITNCVQK